MQRIEKKFKQQDLDITRSSTRILILNFTLSYSVKTTECFPKLLLFSAIQTNDVSSLFPGVIW